jgi:hypothetical protein
VRPDLLKVARAVEDSLSGVAFADDAAIVVEHLVKRYLDVDAGEQIGVHISIEPAPADPPARAAVRPRPAIPVRAVA